MFFRFIAVEANFLNLDSTSFIFRDPICELIILAESWRFGDCSANKSKDFSFFFKFLPQPVVAGSVLCEYLLAEFVLANFSY